MYFIAIVLGASLDPINILLCLILAATVRPWGIAAIGATLIGAAMAMLMLFLHWNEASYSGATFGAVFERQAAFQFSGHIPAAILLTMTFKAIGRGVRILRRA
jgi:hypothetical protein